MTSTTTTATETQTAFVLWFRPPKRPGDRRTWEMLGIYPTEREAAEASFGHPRGSGDYQILPRGQEP